MSLQDLIMQKIKEEITNDPDGVGYAGKTDEEITALLNGNIRKTRVVEDILPPPINRILAGVGSAPNTIEAVDVAQAKEVVLIPKEI